MEILKKINITTEDLGKCKAKLTLSEENSFTKVVFEYDLPDTTIQDDCKITIKLSELPLKTWAPHLTPTDNHIMDRHIFRTPAIIYGFENQTVIMMPDVEIMDNQGYSYYIDQDSTKGEMYIGLSKSKVAEHILYHRDSGATYKEGKVYISFYIMQTNEVLENPYRIILDYFWNKYGSKEFCYDLTQMANLDVYVKHTYDWAFKNWKDVVWQEFELNGITVGAPTMIVRALQSPNYGKSVDEREIRSIWNQAWFCTMRSASGLYRYAKRTKNTQLINYANMTKELVLNFPQDDGLFKTVIATEMGNESGKYASKGWNTAYFGNSDRNPITNDIKNAPYHIADMSFASYYMLIWYSELEKDARLLDYAKKYADKLLSLQDEKGFFPSWIHEDQEVVDILTEGSENAISTVFLLKLFEITKDDKYYDSAKKSIDALEIEIIPNGRWEDFETYWSCSNYGVWNLGKKFERNNMYKQCNLSMFYTAWAYLELYNITNDKKTLQKGRIVLDEMLMTQSSYQPKQIPIPVVGGFGVMNADAELNDARQSLFAEVILKYGELLDFNEYKQRGKAALIKSFAMMYCEENKQAKIAWEKTWSFFNDKDYGFNMENYGHDGVIDKENLGIGEFTIYDWGNGAGAEAYERILAHNLFF